MIPGFKIIAKIDHAIDIVRAHNDEIEVRRILKEIVPEYDPVFSVQPPALGPVAVPTKALGSAVFANQAKRLVK